MKPHCAILLLVFVSSTVEGEAQAREQIGINLIKKLVESFNNRHNDLIKLPNRSVDLPAFTFSSRNAAIGNFSSVELKGDRQVLVKRTLGSLSIFEFDLNLGLRELWMTVDASYAVEPVFREAGNVKVLGGENSIRVKGNLTLSAKGYCKASLKSASIETLGVFTVQIVPWGLVRSVFAYLLQFSINGALRRLLPLINALLGKYAETDLLQFVYSQLVCEAFKSVPGLQ